MPLPAKFATGFAIPGLLISAAFALMSGNRWEHNAFVIVLCTVLSAVLGVVVYSVLKARVPEFFELFQGMTDVSYSQSSDETMAFSGDAPDAFSAEDSTSEGQPASDVAGAEEGPTHFGDHILVDKVKIKNEPRLMAQAIRTLLAKDD